MATPTLYLATVDDAGEPTHTIGVYSTLALAEAACRAWYARTFGEPMPPVDMVSETDSAWGMWTEETLFGVLQLTTDQDTED